MDCCQEERRRKKKKEEEEEEEVEEVTERRKRKRRRKRRRRKRKKKVEEEEEKTERKKSRQVQGRGGTGRLEKRKKGRVSLMNIFERMSHPLAYGLHSGADTGDPFSPTARRLNPTSAA